MKKQAIWIAAAVLCLIVSPGCALISISQEIKAHQLNAAHPYDEPHYSNLLWSLDTKSLYFVVSRYAVNHRVSYDGMMVLPENTAFTMGGGRMEEVDDPTKPSRYALYHVMLGNRTKPIERLCDIRILSRDPSFEIIGWLNERKIADKHGLFMMDLERCAVEPATATPALKTQTPFVEIGYSVGVENGHLVLYDKDKRGVSQFSLPTAKVDLRSCRLSRGNIDWRGEIYLSPDKRKAAFKLYQETGLPGDDYIVVVTFDGLAAEVFPLGEIYATR